MVNTDCSLGIFCSKFSNLSRIFWVKKVKNTLKDFPHSETNVNHSSRMEITPSHILGVESCFYFYRIGELRAFAKQFMGFLKKRKLEKYLCSMPCGSLPKLNLNSDFEYAIRVFSWANDYSKRIRKYRES